jgi:hypothetical protein
MNDVEKSLVLNAALQDVGLPAMDVGIELLDVLKTAGYDLVPLIVVQKQSPVHGSHDWQLVDRNIQRRCGRCGLWQTDTTSQAACKPGRRYNYPRRVPQ